MSIESISDGAQAAATTPDMLPGRALGGPGEDDVRSRLGPCRLHPAWIVIGAVPALRSLAIPLFVVLISGGGRDGWFVGVGLALTVLLTAWRTSTWWTFRYEVADGELRVRSGLIGRRERFIPVERIQSLDTSEGILQRLFGVVSVKIETAAGGSKGSDVTLEALSRADAAVLRDRLTGPAREVAPQRATAPSTPAPTTAGDATLIRALSPSDLFIAGVTSGRVGPALALVVGALQFADDVLPDRIWERVASAAPGLSLRGIVTFLVVLGLLAWLLALGSTVLTFAGFALRRDGDRLLISHGLLDRRRRTIPLRRIQAVRVTEGVLRQPFGLASVHFESAGYGKDSAESGVLFPLVPIAEVRPLLEAACPEFALDPKNAAFRRLPSRARSRYMGSAVTRVLFLTALATTVTALVPWAPWWWGGCLLLLIPLAALYALLCYRDAGWTLDPAERLILRDRGMGRTTSITSWRRLQRREVSRGPFQRRARLGSFRARVASGGSGGWLALRHMDERDAGQLLARSGSNPAAPGRAR